MFKTLTRTIFTLTSRRIHSSEILPVFIGQTGKGKSAIAVIRISGPCSREVLTKVACLKEHQLEPRKALFHKLYNPENGELLDNGIVIWFPGPKSYTGEDSAELHIHGGFAVQCAVINALQKLPGFRIAEPGEFTKRAFIAGKLDATEVEGLADLLRAETDSQRRQALRLANGELAQLYNLWRVSIINCMANLEAYVDFGEDQDIGDEVLSSLENSVSLLIDEIEIHLNDNRRGERLRHGVKVAIIGEPNVGKSSLLNLLSRREAAIVSPFAGTTRDVLEISLDIGGFPVVLCDTAGLRLSDDPVENEGLKRAKSIASMADLVMIVVDPSKISALERSSLTDFIDDQCSQLNVQTGPGTSRVVLINKIDLVDNRTVKKVDVRAISCKTGDGLRDLLDLMQSKLAELCANPLDEAPSITSSRQRFHLHQCLVHLKNFIGIVKRSGDLALAGEQLRKAAKQIGSITGKIYTEEMLDVLFRSFCIGK